MSKLDLTLLERFDAEDADALCAALSEHLALGQPRYFIYRSADPTLTSVIQLVGAAAAWLPLAAPAAVYLSTLARHAGDATWDGVASLFKSEEAKPLADVAKALTATANKADGEVEIVVGLNVPDDHFCTAVRIRDDNPAAVAYKLAAFVVHADELEGMVLGETAAGNAPFGQVTIEVQDDGSLHVKWRSQPDFKEHARRIENDAQQLDR